MMNVYHIRAAMQTALTQRYHTKTLLRSQDVGSHTYRVLLLLAMLNPEASPMLFRAALLHDAGEWFVGDIPAPTKRSSPPMKAALDALESDLLTKATGLIQPVLTETDARWLAFADALEGALWCLEELELGNTTIFHTFETYISYAQGIVPPRLIGESWYEELFETLHRSKEKYAERQ